MNTSQFNCGFAHELAITASKAGWEIKDFDMLVKSEDKCRQVLSYLRGQAEIKLIKIVEAVSDEVVIPTSQTPTTWTIDFDGNIHFTVVSNGMTREQWEPYLKNRGFRLSDWAQNVLRCASEAPTDGVIYNVVVCPGKKWSNKDRITKNIRSYATEKSWKTPHWEVACLIRDVSTDEQLEQMGLLYIVTMHEPIVDSDGDPRLLRLSRVDDGCWLFAGCDRPSGKWSDGGSFAFVVSQVCPKT